MMRLAIASHRKQPGYEIKAIISFSKKSPQEIDDMLAEMRQQLEKTIPGSYKPKCNINHGELIVRIQAKKANEAQSVQHKLSDFIKTAAMAAKVA
jgi:hypothetical protein